MKNAPSHMVTPEERYGVRKVHEGRKGKLLYDRSADALLNTEGELSIAFFQALNAIHFDGESGEVIRASVLDALDITRKAYAELGLTDGNLFEIFLIKQGLLKQNDSSATAS